MKSLQQGFTLIELMIVVVVVAVLAGVTLSTVNYDLTVRILDQRIIDICYPAGSKAIADYGAC